MKLFSTMFLVLLTIFSASFTFFRYPETKFAPVDTQIEEVSSRIALSAASNPIQEQPEDQSMKSENVISETVIQESLYDEKITAEGMNAISIEAYQLSEQTEPEVIYEDVYETVYATTDVNIRTGPGTEFSVLGVSLYGSSVTRTGIGSNGWSQVIYNDDTAYMASEYLSKNNSVSDGPLGTAGRLTIPSVGIDVALYACSSSGEYAAEQQRIVDEIDSAAYITQVHTNSHVIADHNHQGFDAMKSCVPNETYAYINLALIYKGMSVQGLAAV